MEKLLVVIDMQNDFVTGALGSPDAVAVVDGIAAKVARYRAAGDTVLFTLDTHPAADYIPALTREAAAIPPHCIRGTDGWQVVPALRPFSAGMTVEKPTFLSGTLADVIRDRCGGDVAIELCGVCTDICVVSNALALRAAFPAAAITVDGACCAGTSAEKHAAALAVMASCLIDIP